MNIAIKGAIAGTKEIVETITALGEHHVVCILENDGSKVGREIAGVPIVSTICVRKAYRDGYLNAVVLPESLGKKTLSSMARELQAMGIDAEDLYVVHLSVREGGTVIPYDTWQERSLDYFEFHVSHVCNLNCKGCCHFSSLTKRGLPSFDAWNTGVTGGEPLINPELSRYAVRTRELYPDAVVEIVSNAILADRLPKDTIDVLRRAGVKVCVTVYPGVFDRVERGIAFLQAHNLLGKVVTATEFTKMLSEKPQPFPYRTTEQVCHCPNLVGTKLYTCPIIAYLPDFNAQFDANFPDAGGCVELADASLTPARLREKLYRPFPLCAHCRSYLTEGIRASNDTSLAWANYQQGDVPKITDWLLKEE